MRKIIIIAVLLLAAALWLGTRLLAPTVEVVRPQRGVAVQAVYATGTVEAAVMLPVSARSAARLMELNADEGSHVTKGQVLAQLEDSDLQNSIKQLEAREEFAKKEYERAQVLVKQRAVPKRNYDQAKSDLEAARAATREAQAQAAYLQLIAPADGLIIKRDGEIGQLIAANEPVFWLSCCAPLRISSEVDEEDIAQVKPGQEVLIRADAFPEQVFHGRVQAITPKGDPVARSYRVRIEFTEEVPLQIGMTAETNIISERHEDALLLPTSAINKGHVWLVKDGKLVSQPVTIGAKGAAQTEIKEGVADEDMVVLKPDDKLKPGQKVKAKLAQPAKP
jgi:RND family efflux transporter MFP subunit